MAIQTGDSTDTGRSVGVTRPSETEPWLFMARLAAVGVALALVPWFAHGAWMSSRIEVYADAHNHPNYDHNGAGDNSGPDHKRTERRPAAGGVR